MPATGKLDERDYTPQERTSIKSSASALGLTEQESFGVIGDHTCDVFLNDVAHWRNVPTGVWHYSIGGNQVLKKWLSYREKELLGRSLTQDEAREFTQIAQRITRILLLQPVLDTNYKAVVTSVYQWTLSGQVPVQARPVSGKQSVPRGMQRRSSRNVRPLQ